ncbi:hypothetical protein OIU83_09225 [Flavobacterium sp. LS1R49]|uniref:Uncharacterized protein n=1 Tax=Flavobacterium shii TaxID=2987687 RepID=A0A9X2ZDM9_9FLAO|nr:hypothetical protein [Flavobacterium shii]MCV9927832.1 hypothetical protein [Flavobacterium shii]
MDNNIREVYCVADGYVYIFDIKTTIQNKNDLEPIIINDVLISENLSMKFRYILGSLNFMFNETLSACHNVEKKQSIAVKIVKLLLKIIETFEGNMEPTDIEERIHQIDAERVELKLILT